MKLIGGPCDGMKVCPRGYRKIMVDCDDHGFFGAVYEHGLKRRSAQYVGWFSWDEDDCQLHREPRA